jgi:hypothetical protein
MRHEVACKHCDGLIVFVAGEGVWEHVSTMPGLHLGIPPEPAAPKSLEQIADVVLNYRPKSKQPKPRTRKKAKRRATS